MRYDVKPIPTVWNGISFRSRLEAKWAAFFTKVGLAWEYEPEGYSNGERAYLPDFKIVGSSCVSGFYEVKPNWPTEEEWAKATMIGATFIIGSPWMEGTEYRPERFDYVLAYNEGLFVWSICRDCNKTVELLPSYLLDCECSINIGSKFEWMACHGEGYCCCTCNDRDRPPVAAHPTLIGGYLAARTIKVF